MIKESLKFLSSNYTKIENGKSVTLVDCNWIIAVKRSETAHYSYRIQQMHCWRQVLGIQNHDFGMDLVIPSDFYSTFLALWSSIYISTIFVQIFVGEHVFLSNELSAKRLATCISNFNVEYYNLYVQKFSQFLLVPSGLRSLTPAV